MRGHGEGTITQRKDGRWQAQISLGDGKRKTFYGKTKKEVQEKLRVAINEQKQGVLPVGPDQTLAYYFPNWLELVHRPVVQPRTYEQYLSIVNLHLVPGLGKVKLQKLTVQQLRAFYADKIKEGKAPRTVSQYHTVIHKALDDAVNDGLLSRNVASLVRPPVARRYNPQVLMVEQAKKLLESARGHRLEALIIVAVTTGAREGELLGLHWDDIDWEQKVMYVRRSIGRVKGRGLVENDPKTRTSRRKVMLSDVAITALKEHKVLQDSRRVEVGEKWIDKGIVFPGYVGGYLLHQTMMPLFRRLLSEAGLPLMRFHDLRHSAATILLSKGVHPKIVQEMLGHSSITMTMDTYSHLFPSMQQDASSGMDDVFGNS